MTDPASTSPRQPVSAEQWLRDTFKSTGPLHQFSFTEETLAPILTEFAEAYRSASPPVTSELQTFLGPDLSGRRLSELLSSAAHELVNAGGGPLSDCLYAKANEAEIVEAASLPVQQAQPPHSDEIWIRKIEHGEQPIRWGVYFGSECAWDFPWNERQMAYSLALNLGRILRLNTYDESSEFSASLRSTSLVPEGFSESRVNSPYSFPRAALGEKGAAPSTPPASSPVDPDEPPLTDAVLLNSEITKATDNSPCSYDEVIGILEKQLAFWRQAQQDEEDAQKAEGK